MNKFFFRKVLALVIAAIAVVAVYFYTDSTVKQEIAPTNVVVAKQDIPPYTKLTEDLLATVAIPAKALPPNHNYASSVEELVGRWTVEGYGVPKNGYINKAKTLPEEMLPDAGLLSLEEGEYAFSTQVDLQSTHGNSITPNSYVDLYFKYKIDLGEVTEEMLEEQGLDIGNEEKFMEENLGFYGRIAENVRVVDIKDSKGQRVFTPDAYTDTEEAQKNAQKIGVPALYTIAVDMEDLQWLNKAALFGEIVPVVSGKSYENGEELPPLSAEDDELPEILSDIEVTKKVINALSLNPQLIK